MSDPDTIATYEAVADEYRDRHADRDDLAEVVEAFLDALGGSEATDGDVGSAAGDDLANADDSGAGRARVLDVGCGPGWESATFAEAGHDVLGIDLSTAFLDAAAEETAPDADFARMDMRRLGLAADQFDGLWACASFLHVPREASPDTLDGFRRVLADGGVLALTVKRGEGIRAGDAYEADDREFVLYQPAELRGHLEDAGFAIETVENRGEWIFVLARG